MSAQSEHKRVLKDVDCKSFGSALAVLVDRLPSYFAQLREVGFACCHVNDDWIERQCNAADVAVHKRYLVEFAREVLATGKPSPDFGDELNCLSPWLNDLKAQRLAKYGRHEDLWKNWQTRHLGQLSPGWREFFRVKESPDPADQMHVADQVATYVQRLSEEVKAHSEAIARCRNRLPPSRKELALQAFFAEHLVAAFEPVGARMVPNLLRNQVLRRDEQIAAVIFDAADDCRFVLLPLVVQSAGAKRLGGTLGIGFRLMTQAALDAPKFEFGRDTVLYLHELLPNKFNGYGRFDKPEEFCLNVLAWTAALRILLPDVLQTLRAVATAPAPSPLH